MKVCPATKTRRNGILFKDNQAYPVIAGTVTLQQPSLSLIGNTLPVRRKIKIADFLSVGAPGKFHVQ